MEKIPVYDSNNNIIFICTFAHKMNEYLLSFIRAIFSRFQGSESPILSLLRSFSAASTVLLLLGNDALGFF